MNHLENSLGRNPLSDALHRRPGVVLSEQGSLHFDGRVRGVRELALGRHSPLSDALHRCPDVMRNKQGRRVTRLGVEGTIRLASWNIGSLTGKSRELVDTLSRRRVNIACLQETKWVGEKSREIENTGFKLWYTGKERNRNGVGIIIDGKLRHEVVNVNRKGDRIIVIKLVLGRVILNIISAYAPQIGLSDPIKRQFWEDMDEVIRSIPSGEKLIIGGDLNGHVGRDSGGWDRVHGGFGFGNRNDAGEDILDFAISHDLMLVNTYFRKRESHLVTFNSGTNCSQIDFFLTRRDDRNSCKDCKVIPGECLATQHRLLVLDLRIKLGVRKSRSNRQPRTK